MNNLDKQYQDLLQDILDNGVVKGDRTGTGTISVFGRQIRHNMKDGFPLLTTKKMPFKSILTELIWFLKGDTNIKFLVDNGCNIWNGDAYKNYINNPDYKTESVADLMTSQAGQLVKCSTQKEFVEKIKTDDEFAKKWGDLGPIYGRQWRNWNVNKLTDGTYTTTNDTGYMEQTYFGHVDIKRIDQIANLINDLKNNPDSRRLMVNAWNVAEIDDMVLPPCHYGFQLYTRELSFDERWEIFEYLGFAGTALKKPLINETYNNVNCRDEYEAFWRDPELNFNIPTRAISLMWNQRSVDTFLGLPFNIASYGLLLEIIAKEVNMVPDQLIGNLGDTHLYSNHIEQAKEQIGVEMSLWERTNYGIDVLGYNGLLDYGHSQNDDDKILAFLDKFDVPKTTRDSYPLPSLKIKDSWKFDSSSPVFADNLKLDMFELINYKSHETIKAPLSN